MIRKKILTITTVSVLALSLVGCGSATKDASTTETVKVPETAKELLDLSTDAMKDVKSAKFDANVTCTIKAGNNKDTSMTMPISLGLTGEYTEDNAHLNLGITIPNTDPTKSEEPTTDVIDTPYSDSEDATDSASEDATDATSNDSYTQTSEVYIVKSSDTEATIYTQTSDNKTNWYKNTQVLEGADSNTLTALLGNKGDSNMSFSDLFDSAKLETYTVTADADTFTLAIPLQDILTSKLTDEVTDVSGAQVDVDSLSQYTQGININFIFDHDYRFTGISLPKSSIDTQIQGMQANIALEVTFTMSDFNAVDKDSISPSQEIIDSAIDDDTSLIPDEDEPYLDSDSDVDSADTDSNVDSADTDSNEATINSDSNMDDSYLINTEDDTANN